MRLFLVLLLFACVGCRAPREAAGRELATQAARVPTRSPQERECLGPSRVFADPAPPLAGMVPLGVDRAQADLARRMKVGARWIDGFLGDERSVAEENETWARLRLKSSVEDREGSDVGASATLRLVLPKAEERLHLVFNGAGDEDELGAFEADELSPELQLEGEEESASAALQYFLKATSRNNLRLELGARFSGGTPDPYTGLRYRHTVPFDVWALRLSQRVRAYLDRGWESQTRVDVERPLRSDLFFRTTSRVDVYEDEDGSFLGQDLVLYQRLSRRTLLTYELIGDLATDSAEQLDQVVARLRFSQRFGREWIRLELSPQLAWRERYDFATAAGLLLRLDLEIGRSY